MVLKKTRFMVEKGAFQRMARLSPVAKHHDQEIYL
jgi:hypothetical protein